MEVVSAASSRLQNRHTFAAGRVGSAQCVQGTRRSVGGWLAGADLRRGRLLRRRLRHRHRVQFRAADGGRYVAWGQRVALPFYS